MLGNDVVDLRDPESRLETFRPRFEERVFDPIERREIERDENPHARRWAHWAAKESAYKLARQLASDFVFSPASLVIRFQTREDRVDGERRRTGRVALPEPVGPGIREIELRASETADRVHVLALPAGADWEAVVEAVEPLEREQDRIVPGLPEGGPTCVPLDPSRAVRRLAVQHIARDLGIDLERVAVGRRGRIPTVEIDGAPSPMAISLSHHGGWIACAMTHRPADSAEACAETGAAHEDRGAPAGPGASRPSAASVWRGAGSA